MMKNMVSSYAAVRVPWSDWAFDNKLLCTFPIHCNSFGLIFIDSISWHIVKLFLNLINCKIFEDSSLLGCVVSRFLVNVVRKACNSAIFTRKMMELQAFLTPQTTNPSTQHHIAEELNAMIHCCENLKSCIRDMFWM